MINLLSMIAASTNRDVKGKGLKSLAFVVIESSSKFIIAHSCEDLFADASLSISGFFLVTGTQYGQSFAAIILVHCQITRITKVDEQFPKAKVIVIDRPTNVWIAFQFSNGIDYGAGSPLCGRGDFYCEETHVSVLNHVMQWQ